MATSIYLVNPSADFPTYFGAESFIAHGLQPATRVADLAIPTLAAFVPGHVRVVLCDQNIEPVDLEADVDFVGITGKISQFGHMKALAREFRARGKVVIIGGPFATLSPELVRPHCDVLVRGEIEEIAPKLFADLERRRYLDEYVGGQPSLDLSPIPRWDLYRNERAMMGTLQTSRGCPFECEFCDVIQYAGRKQRHKSIPRILAELDVLYRHSYRSIFLADDNFTVFRARARELLQALAAWNRRQERGRVSFVTQVSIDCVRDDELLSLGCAAGLEAVFIGIETPNQDSLRETKKRQNLRVDLVDQVHAVLAHGIQVLGGMIVGFDSDGPDIFERQLAFARASGIPILSLGALVAPAATPLHARMLRVGRLKPAGSEVAAVPWATNIVHPTMSEAQLRDGLRWLGNSLYHPQAFGERLSTFLEKLGPRSDPESLAAPSEPRAVELDTMAVVHGFLQLGPIEREVWRRVHAIVQRKGFGTSHVLKALVQYMQIRHMYAVGHFWDPRLAGGALVP
jgi:hypothetical protein